MFWDSTYVLVLLGMVISLLASWNVTRAFKTYSRYSNMRGMTAEECARNILHGAGIYDVRIEHVNGTLTDHYSPNEKVLRLSDSVYGSTSIAACGVAAHECGHAIQHQDEYVPLKLRSVSIPVANIGSKLSWPIILIGMILGKMDIARIGVLLFGFVVIFQFLTLPVEFNASRRALGILENRGMLRGEEMDGAAKVLRAAALTYVASLFSSMLQLLRLVLLTRGGGRRRN